MLLGFNINIVWFRISKDVDFAHKIAGVLVESDGYPSKPTGFIPSKKQQFSIV